MQKCKVAMKFFKINKLTLNLRSFHLSAGKFAALEAVDLCIPKMKTTQKVIPSRSTYQNCVTLTFTILKVFDGIFEGQSD